MAFIAYYRVSTQKQGRSGLGLEAQKHSVCAYAANAGQIIASHTDIESGKRDDRPELEKALTRCRLTGSTLLIAKLDRLSRNKAFLFTLMESQVKFVCADMPEANEMTLGFMAMVADYEGKAISERTKAALAAAKARGVKLGNPQNLTNRDTTAATQARSTKAQDRNAEIRGVIDGLTAEYGPMSLRAMADRLNNEGFLTSRGCKWRPQAVSRVINTNTQTKYQTAQEAA